MKLKYTLNKFNLKYEFNLTERVGNHVNLDVNEIQSKNKVLQNHLNVFFYPFIYSVFTDELD